MAIQLMTDFPHKHERLRIHKEWQEADPGKRQVEDLESRKACNAPQFGSGKLWDELRA
jgi:hypothetical protein